jgi:hypothetical protein
MHSNTGAWTHAQFEVIWYIIHRELIFDVIEMWKVTEHIGLFFHTVAYSRYNATSKII